MTTVIDKIYNDILQGNYTLFDYQTEKAVKQSKTIPETVDIKDLIFHYVYYTIFKKDYFDLSWYVVIPQTEIDIPELEKQIDVIVYIKYKIKPLMIPLKHENNIENYSVKQLKQYCKDHKIKGYSKMKKQQLKQYIKDAVFLKMN
jgi:hypothetical protein